MLKLSLIPGTNLIAAAVLQDGQAQVPALAACDVSSRAGAIPWGLAHPRVSPVAACAASSGS